MICRRPLRFSVAASGVVVVGCEVTGAELVDLAGTDLEL